MRAARRLVLCATLALAANGWNNAWSATSDEQLVVLAEPQPPEAVATSRGPVTLPYRVVEVFAGEPGAASIIVRHEVLESPVRARLAAGERVIVVARPDPGSPGRWIAPSPLRATDQAVAAFRRWGAPEDVRQARPLADVVAEAISAPATGDSAATRVVDSGAEDVLEREEWPTRPAAERAFGARVSAATSAAPAAASRAGASPATASPVAAAPRDQPPATVHAPATPPAHGERRARLPGLPSRGPGLPPPPSSRPLVSRPGR